MTRERDQAAGGREGRPLAGKRILIAKPGLDGHDIGAKVVALALRDAGAEVVYTGLRKSPEFIACAAIDEGVDAIGLSVLSGSHLELVAETMEQLRGRGAGDLPVLVGGTIPAEDHAALRALGVRAVFTASMRIDDVVAAVSEAIR